MRSTPIASCRISRIERETSGEHDPRLDKAVEGSSRGPGNTLLVPHIAIIHQRLIESVEQMCAPARVASPDGAGGSTAHERRLRAIREQLPEVTGDTVAVGYVDAVTQADRHGPDSVHLLVMDLHRELNRIQSQAGRTVAGRCACIRLYPTPTRRSSGPSCAA